MLFLSDITSCYEVDVDNLTIENTFRHIIPNYRLCNYIHTDVTCCQLLFAFLSALKVVLK